MSGRTWFRPGLHDKEHIQVGCNLALGKQCNEARLVLTTMVVSAHSFAGRLKQQGWIKGAPCGPRLQTDTTWMG